MSQSLAISQTITNMAQLQERFTLIPADSDLFFPEWHDNLPELTFNPRQPNRNAYYEFLNEALQTIRRIKDKDIKDQRRQGEELLESNLDKLDDKFSKMLRSWAKAKLSTVEPEEAQTIAGLIHDFCTYIAQFPRIKPEIK
ncbi:MAG: hypothetical protein RIG63_00480 [Coleofasciculus chthonoplastes F3-SA18-01]